MKGILNKHFTVPQVVAVELFSSGWCNLSCKYCYIPKTDFLKKVHRGIIQSIEDGTFINNLKVFVIGELNQPSQLENLENFMRKLEKHFQSFLGVRYLQTL